MASPIRPLIASWPGEVFGAVSAQLRYHLLQSRDLAKQLDNKRLELGSG